MTKKGAAITGRPVRPAKKTMAWWLPFLVLAGVALLVGGGFTGAMRLEESKGFCASCHTQPETDFYQRSLAATATDLASSHQLNHKVNCVDCHSGKGLAGRAAALMLGAQNSLKFFTHSMIQPAPLTVPIGDGNCLKCHDKVVALGTPTMNNHFHMFLPRWQLKDPKAAGCVDCHTSHSTNGSVDQAYLETQRTEAVCQRCHAVLREED